MPEHTIPSALPDALIQNIRSNRAALVVGTGLGVPSWKQLLERLNQALRERGGDGDEAAARDVDKLLHKASLVRAAGFLGRALGSEVCDRLVGELWNTPEPLPEIAQAIARLPFRQVWTTFPGDILERAMNQDLPEGWQAPNVLTYQQAGAVDRRRTLLKVLGDFGSYVVTPISVRKKLSSASDLLDHVRSYYQEGTLFFVGFRYGDPDLAALLDRLFGSFEPPQSQHFMVASGVGPVTVDELVAEHHIELINLPGRGADETATAALIELLDELAERCEETGVTLAMSRPDADDLEAWLEMLAQDSSDPEAAAAVVAIQERATAAGDWDRLVEVLMARIEVEESGAARAGLLRRVAEIFEERIGDLPRAFTALTAAVVEDPADTRSVDEAERLADAADGWTELVSDVSGVADQIEDRAVAAEYWARVGRWYHEKLDHLDYAVASYRQAIKLDAENQEAHAGLAAIYRIQQRWTELADALAACVELELDGERRRVLFLEIGEIQENQLASVSRATEAYERAAELAIDSDDALAALERLYRRGELWDKLARVLERRADLFEQRGEAGRANTARHELATLRAEKLGDLEGAIGKYEAALESDSHNLEALRALEELYEKTGRTPDYLRTLERLADVAPEAERPAILRRLAAELEERPGGREEAARAYRRVLDLEPGAQDAYRSLARVLAAAERWDELAECLSMQVAAATEPEARAQIDIELGRLYEERQEDPHRAIEAYLEALAQVPDSAEALTALARLYTLTETFDRAVEVLVQHARLAGDGGAHLWAEAGRLAHTAQGELDSAERHLEKALELDPDHLGALRALADLHEQRGNWASAVSRLAEAARASGNRLEKVELLARAAQLADSRLEEPARALELCLAVLEIDPEHRESGRLAAERLLAAERHEEALSILEMLARTAGEDRAEVAHWESELGRAANRLGQRQKAAKHLRRAAEADPGNIGAFVGLADALFDEAEALVEEERWRQAETAYRDLLSRHRGSMAADDVAQAWFRIGLAARHLGEAGKARDALSRSLEAQPAFLPALELTAELATEAADWRGVVAARRAMVGAVSGERKVEVLESLGDVLAAELGDTDGALAAYLEARELAPESHTLLHKTLDIYSAKKQWKKAVEACRALADTAKASERRAKYYYAAAVIARDELGAAELAVEHFNLALEENPDHPKAFGAIEALLAESGDYKNLARAYRKRLKQLAEDPSEGLRLWTRLGDLCAEHLNDVESAIAAYEVAVSLEPDSVERHEQLANLYLEAGEPRRRDAIAQLQILLAHSPDRVELFKALSGLYRAEGDTDKAFCLAQALVFLGAASQNERDIYEHLRPQRFTPARRRLTEELWQKSIIHGRESRHVNVIFQQLAGPLAATTAQPPSAFHLEESGRAGAGDLLAARVLRYAVETLGLDREPELYVRGDLDGFRVANTSQSGKLVPSVLVGGAPLQAEDERELAFDVGKRLCYLRPDRFVNYALGSLPKIEVAFSAALEASGVGAPISADGVVQLAGVLRKSVPSAVLDQVAAVARKMPGDLGNGLIAHWRTATDLTANRVGLILCNDLEVAARRVATEAGGLSAMPVKERLRDLLAYSVSEEYFAVRRHLGLSVAEARA